LYPQCSAIWATDSRWWKHHIGDITRDYDGRLYTQNVQWDQIKVDPAQWGIKSFTADTGAGGLNRDPDKINTGQNGGFAAIGLAYKLMNGEPGRIILLGYDMQMRGDKRHFFGAHPDGLEVASNYGNFIARFQTIRPEDYGLEIWNCTRDTALHHFPLLDLDEVVEKLSDTAQV